MKYVLAFNNTRLQTGFFLDELAKQERAATTELTLYDPVLLKEVDEGLRSVKFFHKGKDLPWTYTQDKAVFAEECDYVIFGGNFDSLEVSKIGSMMRDFTRDLQIHKDVKEICFLGNIRGLLQASICFKKFPELGEKIRCYSAEVYIGGHLGVTVYPKPDEKFLVLRNGKPDPEAEKEVNMFSKMFVKYHATKMWIAFFSETMDGEDFSPEFYGRVISEGESKSLRTGSKLIIFLPAVVDEEMPGEMTDAGHETYKKIKELLKNA